MDRTVCRGRKAGWRRAGMKCSMEPQMGCWVKAASLQLLALARWPFESLSRRESFPKPRTSESPRWRGNQH